LEILLDFVTSPYFTEETVSKEMGIIGQEIRMYDDNPGWQLYFGMLTGLYHDNTVRIDTAGDTDTIAKITPELLFEAYNAFYNLENMVLCICGDVDEKQVESVCDKVLKYVKAPKVKRIYPEEKKGRFKEFISKKLEVSMPMFSVGIKDNECPLSGVFLARKQAEYDILLELMFGKSSEFYTRMYQSGLIDSSFGFGYEAGETYGHCELSGSSMKPLEVYEAIKEEIKKYKEKGVDKGAFERIKRANYASTLRVFNSTEDVTNEFLVHAFSEFDMLEYPEVISQVTFEQVCSRLDRCFEEDDFVLSCVYPLDK
jgi:predicted Zn-dependent peptidase